MSCPVQPIGPNMQPTASQAEVEFDRYKAIYFAPGAAQPTYSYQHNNARLPAKKAIQH